MNQPINKIRSRLPHIAASASVALTAVIAVSALMAQTTPTSTKQWPTQAPYDDAICAFDKALTKASRDKAFRDRLTESCDSAKKAVAEIGEINIPDDRVIIFYEGEAAELRKRKVADFKNSRSSEKIHVFVLPDWSDKGPHRYEEYFVGMYEYWLRKNAPCELPK